MGSGGVKGLEGGLLPCWAFGVQELFGCRASVGCRAFGVPYWWLGVRAFVATESGSCGFGWLFVNIDLWQHRSLSVMGHHDDGDQETKERQPGTGR